MDPNRKRAVSQELGIPVEVYEELLTDYFKDGSERIALLVEAVGRNDLSAVAETAHALKGSSQNLRITDIAELAKQLESAAKSGRPADLIQEILLKLTSVWKHAIE